MTRTDHRRSEAQPVPQAATSLEELLAKTLPQSFYTAHTLEISRQLLGKTLVCIPPDQEGQADPACASAGIIVETEGYVGPEDPACHAYVGRTRRNDVMWGEPGRAYVYFTYGNHWMINAVTGPDGYAAAVLIRALEPILGIEQMRERRGLHRLKGKPEDRNLTNGPGKLCQAMGIDGSYNGQSLGGPRLYLTDTPAQLALPPFEIVESTRIGISRGVDLPWRYYVRGNRYVSRL
ncbi:MAG TPA: DNA-3-methyladenine glycosylase [Chloroflexia bacterium]|nr:DNA-3-methyladenine glycosylase [Chloroflexia bacterium]